jgi:hypothetical protein
MRRVGVGAWTATIVAGVFPLFGSGEENILWAFQIGFIGSLLFGLLHVITADHPDPLGRRDFLGLLLGFLAIGSPGAGPLMIVAVGVVCLLRRGERAALFHTVPLAVCYLAWYVAADPQTQDFFGPPTLSVSLRWAWHGLLEPLAGVTKNRVIGVALAVVVIVGLALAIRASGRMFWRRLAVPLTLFVLGPAFYLMVAQGRWFAGLDMARSGRYVYTATALMLPAAGVAAQALIRSRPRSAPVVFVVLLAGVPANIDRFDASPIFNSAYYRRQRDVILGIAHSPYLQLANPWVRFEPESYKGSGLTVGWMRRAVAEGKVPEPGPIDPSVSSEFILRLGLVQGDFNRPEPFSFCETRTEPLDLTLHQGDHLRINSEIYVTQMELGEPVSTPVRYLPEDGSGVLSMEAPVLDIRINGAWGNEPYSACLLE